MSAERRRSLLEARSLALDALALSCSAPERARRLCDAALSRAVPLGLSDALADILRWNGIIHRDSGNLVEAEGCYNHSLSVANASLYPAGRAQALNSLGSLAQLRGNLDRARALYGEASRIASELDDRRLMATIEQNLGVIAGDQGRTEEAAMHFRVALASLDGAGEAAAVMWLLNNLGVQHTRDGLPRRAIHDLERALALALQLGDARSEGIIEENRASALLMLGQFAEAEHAAERAREIAEGHADPLRLATALHLVAAARARQGRGASELIGMLERAVRLIESTDDVSLLTGVLMDLGDRYRETSQREKAEETWERARALADGAGMRAIVDAVASRTRSISHQRGPEARSSSISAAGIGLEKR